MDWTGEKVFQLIELYDFISVYCFGYQTITWYQSIGTGYWYQEPVKCVRDITSSKLTSWSYRRAGYISSTSLVVNPSMCWRRWAKVLFMRSLTTVMLGLGFCSSAAIVEMWSFNDCSSSTIASVSTVYIHTIATDVKDCDSNSNNTTSQLDDYFSA